MQLAIKKRVRATPPTLVGDWQVESQGNRPRNVIKVSRTLDVSTPLNPVFFRFFFLFPKKGNKKF
jgi:hypothetical protein